MKTIKRISLAVVIGVTVGVLTQGAVWALLGHHPSIPIGGIVAGAVTVSAATMMGRV